MLNLVFVLVLTSPFVFDSDPSPIVIRHDQPDSAYIALGAQFPAVGKVGRSGGDGTLIAPTWVLTAAHVADGMARRTNGRFQVLFGEDEKAYDVAQVIVHPGFAPMGPHDIALVRLAEPVSDITPAKLYAETDEQGQMIVLVGHGYTKTGRGREWIEDRIKRGATNTVNAVSPEHIGFTFDAPPEATDLEGTAGPGDSGGPAFILQDDVPYVAGVSSLGEPGENGPGTYGAREHYVRVSSYIDWIEEMMTHPPAERLVNVRTQQSRQGPGQAIAVEGGPGGIALPEGVVDVFGLLFHEQGEGVQMVGRIDEIVPSALNALQLRPPAQLQAINETRITSTADVQAVWLAIQPGGDVTLTFLHQSQKKEITLKKPAF